MFAGRVSADVSPKWLLLAVWGNIQHPALAPVSLKSNFRWTGDTLVFRMHLVEPAKARTPASDGGKGTESTSTSLLPGPPGGTCEWATFNYDL